MSTNYIPSGLPGDPFYVRRPEVAKLLLSSLETTSHARCLYEDRRMGKSLFLGKELRQLAEAAGYKVIEHSFYSDLGSESRELAFVLKLARETSDTMFDNVTSWVTDKLAKIPLSAKVSAAGVELSTRLFSPADSYAKVLGSVFHELDKRDFKLLLILDEFQEIAKGKTPPEVKANTALLRNMRDCFDARKPALKIVFAGSHQTCLKRIFCNDNGAFFGFATEFTLPRFQPDVVNELMRRHTLNGRIFPDGTCELLQAHYSGVFANNPWRTRRYLEIRGENPAILDDAAVAQVMKELPVRPNYEAMFAELKAVHRHIVKGIAKGIDAPFAKASVLHFSKEAGVPLTAAMVQAAVKTLSRGKNAVFYSDDEGLHFLLPDFGEWLANL